MHRVHAVDADRLGRAQDGRVVVRLVHVLHQHREIELTPIEGGRREGYRTFSRKTAFPGDPAGPWTVDVTTASGQLIGRLSFRVVP